MYILQRVTCLLCATLMCTATSPSPTGAARHPRDGAETFSPRMDFERWRPLTGRGDPLRNDPTYDYEPPLLDRVHYWADERERRPLRSAEVLMLGVTARRPHEPSERYPVTVLVPPPPPPPGHRPPLFGPPDEPPPTPSEAPLPSPGTPLAAPPATLPSFYALQKSNLIYQSSSTQGWRTQNATAAAGGVVSSDYAGWGPTTPSGATALADDSHNLIPHDRGELSHHPYAFYRPMLSEAPPPPVEILRPAVVSTFLPTVLPPTVAPETSTTRTQQTRPAERTTPATTEVPTEAPPHSTTQSEETVSPSTPSPTTTSEPVTSVFDMLGPMLSMPLVEGPHRPDDGLLAYASENIQIYEQHNTEDAQIQTMQTMQPPPRAKVTVGPNVPLEQVLYVTSRPPGRGPHAPAVPDAPAAPMYLIIQGHSKVKTYGSKPSVPTSHETITNEITKPMVTDQVKHLHTKKSIKKLDTTDVSRNTSSKNLKSLIERGLGSIELQEADVGIKYDVSDGSGVPAEVYARHRRQLELVDLLPFDFEEDIEEYIYKYLESRRNETGITGLIAQAVTSEAAAVLDDLQDDETEEGANT